MIPSQEDIIALICCKQVCEDISLNIQPGYIGQNTVHLFLHIGLYRPRYSFFMVTKTLTKVQVSAKFSAFVSVGGTSTGYIFFLFWGLGGRSSSWFSTFTVTASVSPLGKQQCSCKERNAKQGGKTCWCQTEREGKKIKVTQ